MSHKKNNNILKTTLIILGIASVIAGVVYSYGSLNHTVEDNAKWLVEQKEENALMHNMNIRQDKDIVEIKGDLRHLKEDVGDIKGDMTAQTTILQEVLREVRK